MKFVSIVVNHPSFIEYQFRSIKTFVRSSEPCELIVFNDAKTWRDITNFGDLDVKRKIHDMCKKWNITCIDIPNENHFIQRQASIRHADSMTFVTTYMMQHPDTYFVIDSDMFFVSEFDVDKWNPYYFCYVDQVRMISNRMIHYPWPNIFYMDTTQIPNKELINWYPVEGLDSGGRSAEWLSALDKEKTFLIHGLISGTWDHTQIPPHLHPSLRLFLDHDPRNPCKKNFAELFHDSILHYRAGSNWMNDSHQRQHSTVQSLLSTLDSIYMN